MMQLAQEELNMPVEERTVGKTEAYIADEVFLCGTGVQIEPIVSVDGIDVEQGSLGT